MQKLPTKAIFRFFCFFVIQSSKELSKHIYMNFSDFLAIYFSATTMGFLAQVVLMLILYYFVIYRETGLGLMLEMSYEKAFEFFENMLGKKQEDRVKEYVVVLFFTILLSNFLGIFLEFIAPIF